MSSRYPTSEPREADKALIVVVMILQTVMISPTLPKVTDAILLTQIFKQSIVIGQKIVKSMVRNKAEGARPQCGQYALSRSPTPQILNESADQRVKSEAIFAYINGRMKGNVDR